MIVTRGPLGSLHDSELVESSEMSERPCVPESAGSDETMDSHAKGGQKVDIRPGCRIRISLSRGGVPC